MKVYILTIWERGEEEYKTTFSTNGDNLKQAEKALLEKVNKYLYNEELELCDGDEDEVDFEPAKKISELSEYEYCYELYCHDIDKNAGKMLKKYF